MYPIITYPDKRLAEKSEECVLFGKELETLAQNLIGTMEQRDGMGMSAPQLGVPHRVIALKTQDAKRPIVIVNPVTELTKGKNSREEGCLSIPNVWAQILRPEKVRIAGKDVAGNPITYGASGYFARAAMHEMDHLDGILLWDHMEPEERGIAEKIYLKNARFPGAM